MLTFEGIVENGRIRLSDQVTLPENSKVLVVVSDSPAIPQAHLRSPRLANSADAERFAKRIIQVPGNGKV